MDLVIAHPKPELMDQIREACLVLSRKGQFTSALAGAGSALFRDREGVLLACWQPVALVGGA